MIPDFIRASRGASPIRWLCVLTLFLVVVCGAEPDQPRENAPQVDAPFIPTPQDVVDKMLSLAKPTKNELVYDLGCGDGRIVVTAAKRYGCKAVGFDIDPNCVRLSLQNAEQSGVANLVSIEQKDIFKLDLSKADVVTLYLLPPVNARLIGQLEKLKPGCRIVSHSFGIRTVRPDKVVELTSKIDNRKHRIYVWTTPLKKIVRRRVYSPRP